MKTKRKFQEMRGLNTPLLQLECIDTLIDEFEESDGSLVDDLLPLIYLRDELRVQVVMGNRYNATLGRS
jgi:hypothetical protein